MNPKNPTPSLFAGIVKFFNEVGYALFISSDKRDYQRLKDFLAS